MTDSQIAPPISQVTIVGLGLMGASLALAIRKFHPGLRLVGCDVQAQVGTEALRLGMVDEFQDLEALDASGSQLVFVATPVGIVANVVRRLARRVNPPWIVTDVGSTKASIQTELRSELPPGFCYIGGHPMCGSDLEGLEGADPYLYENAVYILTPDDRVPDERLHALEAFLGRLGANVLKMDSDTHDSIVACTSHLPYLAAVALVTTFVDNFEGQRDAHTLAAGGFHDTTRIAGCPPAIWRDICLSNRHHVLKALRQMVIELESLGDAISSSDGERLLKIFSRARNLRASLPPYRKGLLPTPHELVIKAQDRPGFIGEIAGVLGQAGLNIRDVQVLRVREGEGGSLAIALAGEEELKKSLELLEGAGFVARRR
jgi:prephenate dehydrogenase